MALILPSWLSLGACFSVVPAVVRVNCLSHRTHTRSDLQGCGRWVSLMQITFLETILMAPQHHHHHPHPVHSIQGIYILRHVHYTSCKLCGQGVLLLLLLLRHHHLLLSTSVWGRKFISTSSEIGYTDDGGVYGSWSIYTCRDCA